jgi:peroxiredoxin
MELILVGIVLPWLIVALGCWLGYQLLRQNGRILRRLETLEQRRAPVGTPSQAAPDAPPGLPLGSAAPDFALPDLSGTRKALSDFRGKRLLLVFFNPRCGFCARMAPDLAALRTDGAEGRPLPLVVSTGDSEANRTLVAAHGLRCPVLLDASPMEVASQYQAHGTPIGYLVDEEGKIASELAIGADALLALAEKGAAGAVSANGHKEHKGNRSLADSKLNRNGLPAGTPAPGFLLPALEGGALSLEQFRGRPVLLVFSDPQCGPCSQLMPHLEQFHRRTGEVQVLMISRGEPEANRAKAAEHGLTFPILLQKQWEISRAYGMFATPIAYLLDEEGETIADVAVGVEAILTLLAGAAAAREQAPARRCGCGQPLGECGCGKKKRAAAVAAGLPKRAVPLTKGANDGASLR